MKKKSENKNAEEKYIMRIKISIPKKLFIKQKAMMGKTNKKHKLNKIS